MSKLTWSALAVAVFFGLLAGQLWPRSGPAMAAQWHEFWFDIPTRQASGDTADLTCGWHTVCIGEDSGAALDWGQSPFPAQHGVYLRGAGLAPSFNVGTWAVPRSAPRQLGSDCEWQVVLDMYNFDTDEWQVSLVYTHAHSPQSPTSVWYGTPAQDIPGYRIATMATSPDPAGCEWEAPHVHVYGFCCSPIGLAENRAGYPETNQISPIPYNNRTWTHYYAWYGW